MLIVAIMLLLPPKYFISIEIEISAIVLPSRCLLFSIASIDFYWCEIILSIIKKTWFAITVRPPDTQPQTAWTLTMHVFE